MIGPAHCFAPHLTQPQSFPRTTRGALVVASERAAAADAPIMPLENAMFSWRAMVPVIASPQSIAATIEGAPWMRRIYAAQATGAAQGSVFGGSVFDSSVFASDVMGAEEESE